MTTKQQYEMVITDADSTLAGLHTLEASIDQTDLILDDQITVAENALLAIISSAQDKLDLIEQEQVMNDFLAELKLVFDKYTAKIEVGTTTDGYGMDWGGATPNAGVRLTAMFGGVTATKEINKSVIVSGDLV